MQPDAYGRFPAHLAAALETLEEQLRAGLPWQDDPYTEYTVKAIPYDCSPDGKKLLVRTEITDSWNDPMRPWCTQVTTSRGAAVLDAESGALESYAELERTETWR